ncbi:MAG: glycosyltransferase family 4 protein [Gammaproteobacteria bacterium]|nr:glycosyltransferase family 4 protein [Gammaproteobacteria bacterium]
MRIGFLIYGDINTISGGYLYDRKLIEYCEKQGDEVSIISLCRENYFQSVVSKPLAGFINARDYDVIIEDELAYPSLHRINNTLKKQVPVITLVHLFHSFSMQPGYINWLYQIFEKKYLSTVDGLILNSKSTYDQARQLMGEKLARHVIAYPAGDNFDQKTSENTQTPIYNHKDTLNILYIGNVIKQKGLHVLLRSLTLLDKNSFKLTITGNTDMEPGYTQSIQNLIQTNQLSNQVEFTGQLPVETLPETYNKHHVMVLPSQNEAFGIVYLEAMQFGLPVIGTTSGGAKEIIQHGINGYLVNPEDAKMIAQYIQHWIDEPETVSTMGDNARRSYHQHPTWDNTGQNIREFILSCLRGTGKHHG